MSGTYAYLAAGNSGLRIIDVSDPAAPFEANFYPSLSYTTGVDVVEDVAYVADSQTGLRIIDVADPTSITELGVYLTPGIVVQDVAAAGSYVYIADASSTSGALRVVDVSDPAAPVEVGYYDTPGSPYRVVADESYAYLADGGGGLLILKFSAL